MPVVVVSTKKKKVTSGDKGYFCTGYSTAAGGSDSDNTDRFIFATEVMAQIAATVAIVRDGAFGCDSATKGYIIAGYARALGSYSGNVEALLFSNETIANLGTIVYDRAGGSSAHNTNIGYCFGGSRASAAELNYIDGLIYSSETLRSVTETLDNARRPSGNMQNSTTGFICGGYDQGGWPDAAYKTIENFTFSTEVIATASESLERIIAEYATNSFSDDGYCFAGRTYSGGLPNFFKSVEKLNLATGTTSTIADELAAQKDAPSGINQATKGLIAGGTVNLTSYTPSYSSEKFNPTTEAIDAISAVLTDAYSGHCTLEN